MAERALAQPVEHASRRAQSPLSRLVETAALYVVVAAGSLVSMFPFVWTFLSSGKEPNELYRLPPTWWPVAPRFAQNYAEVMRQVPFGQWLLNTAIVTVLALVGTVISATVVAYSFSRFRYPGRDLFFFITLGTLMIPGEVVLIPSYLLFKNLGWLDTFAPLIVPSWLGGGAFNIFLMRQFMLGIPFDLDEAAKIDGASSFRVLWQIIVPLCKPALATMAALGFIGHWNSFLGPLIYLNDPMKYTVAVGLRYFQSGVAQGSAVSRPQDHLLMAASLMMALPCLILFFVAQKYFVRGIVMTGIKG